MPLSQLNEEQFAAASAPLGYNLVIASAGTGKTSTIVGRIAYLLKEGVPPEKILLLTFTNKAAGEMIARLGRYFPQKTVGAIEAGTFHAVCYRWLKKYRPSVALKQPAELKTLFRSIYEKRNFKRIPSDSEPFSATFIYDMYSLYQNSSLGTFDSWFLQKYPEHEGLMDAYLDIINEYEETKEEYGFVSFNDLIVHTNKYMNELELSLEEVLVDEYQDTNTLQGAFIDEIASPSLFCVGDYDQSIYAFNGANIENISTFTERYPDARVYTLVKNYRSKAPILSLANRVIEKNPRIYPKTLEVGRKESAKAPVLLVFDELFTQYHSIARKIGEGSTDYEDIAVIFRNNSSADGIEASLRELGIPSRRKGGTSFFEAREIKFLLDLLSLLHNPKDMMAFIHIFEYGNGIGSSLAKELFQSLVHFGEGELIDGTLRPTLNTLPKLNPNKNVQLGLFDDDLEVGSASRFSGMGFDRDILSHPVVKHPRLNADGLRFFIDFRTLLEAIEKEEHPRRVLRKAISSSLYERVVNTLSGQRAKLKSGEIDRFKMEESREKIYAKASLLLELSSQYRELGRFVNAMILGGNELSEGSGVNLLTVHASKGLEFTEVYVVDLMDGRFPNRKLMSRSGGDIEEERRLFYVAVTRARDMLYLSYAKYDRVRKMDFKPSPFLEEAGLIERAKESAMI
jgi:DNA helicase-2/ATP-dependent DNA helicase PcrA